MFNTKRINELKFYLFNFHKYFDCLLGVDNSKYLKELVDFSTKLDATLRQHLQNATVFKETSKSYTE
nr:unnamed protein product [Callosobruchus chinensis]